MVESLMSRLFSSREGAVVLSLSSLLALHALPRFQKAQGTLSLFTPQLTATVLAKPLKNQEAAHPQVMWALR